MKDKTLTRKDMTVSAFAFLLNIIIQLCIVFVCIIAMNGSEVWSYIRDNYENMIIILTSVVLLSLTVYYYFYFEDKSFLKNRKKMFELFFMMYVSVILCIVVGYFVEYNARPTLMFALLCAVIFGRRNASFLNVVFALLMFVLDCFSGLYALPITEYCADLLIIFLTGTLVIFISNRFKTRIQCVLLAFLMLIPIEIITVIVNFSRFTSWGTALNYLMYGALDSVFSTLFFLFFLPIFEKMFSNLTVFRLRELASDDAKLIRLMKNKAKGSYNHSIMVAQLAEACAKDIGENGELARAAAYYHDVGKMKAPDMFTENQTGKNFHDEITPELSVDIIRSHTRDGAQLIRKNHLPEFFARVALEHHGTMPIKYFYAKALKLSDREIKVENYSYPGPIPSSKIAAVIMIADCAEAAARSLKDRSADKVEELVRNLIEERLDMGQFDGCAITMNDLATIKDTLVTQLTGVYHTRIEYPKLKVSRNR